MGETSDGSKLDVFSSVPLFRDTSFAMTVLFRYLTERLKRFFCVASTVSAILKFSQSCENNKTMLPIDDDFRVAAAFYDLLQPLRSITGIRE